MGGAGAGGGAGLGVWSEAEDTEIETIKGFGEIRHTYSDGDGRQREE